MLDLKDILSCTFQKRVSLNTRYSKNAFARDLGVSPTALSQFLSGKRTFSRTNLNRIIQSLYLPTDTIEKINIGHNESSLGTRLKLDTFSLVAEWYHFAILNLVEIETIKFISQISKRIGVSDKIVAEAVERLLKLGFLKKMNGTYTRIHVALDAGTDIPSEALRKHNREKMEMAIQSLEQVPLQSRDISSLTLTFDPNKMHKIK
jgi:transcriptional regulator with XRE-family HTH domain